MSDYLISTHALREEGDLRLQDVPELYAISTHALREEGDVMSMPSCVEIGNFYPRPPRGGRQTFQTRSIILSAISTHALCEEGDPVALGCSHIRVMISIHALREEGDPPTACFS